MYCEQCGASIVDDAVFCSYCGVRVAENDKNPKHLKSDGDVAKENFEGSDPSSSKISTDMEVAAEDPGFSSDLNSVDDDISETREPEIEEAFAESEAASAEEGASKTEASTNDNGEEQIEAKHERPIFMPARAPKRLSGKTIAAICVLLIAVIAIVVGLILFNIDQQDKAYRVAHPVAIKVDAPGYSDNDTLIPVKITGRSIDEEEFNEVFFIDSEGVGIELQKGSYVMRFPASPLTEDGILYDVPDEAFELALSDGLESGSAQDLSNKIVLMMTKSTALEESDAMIQDAYGYAMQDPAQEEKAEALKNVAEQVHSDAIAEEEARLAEEAKRQAEEKAMRKALKTNPKTIGLSSTPNLTKKAKLTGTVVYKKVSVPNSTKKQYVCYLKLPEKVSIPGTVYGEISSSKIILPAKSFKKYKGQTITISAQYEIDTTTTIAAASVSKIHAYKAKLSKAWDL